MHLRQRRRSRRRSTGRRTAVVHRKRRHLVDDSRSRSQPRDKGRERERETPSGCRECHRVTRAIFQCCCPVHLGTFADPDPSFGYSARCSTRRSRLRSSCGNNLFLWMLARGTREQEESRKKERKTPRGRRKGASVPETRISDISRTVRRRGKITRSGRFEERERERKMARRRVTRGPFHAALQMLTTAIFFFFRKHAIFNLERLALHSPLSARARAHTSGTHLRVTLRGIREPATKAKAKAVAGHAMALVNAKAAGAVRVF